MRRSCLLRNGAAGIALLTTMVWEGAAYGQAMTSRPLQLAVSINGVDTEKVGSFLERDGRLFATAEELRSLGLSPDPVVMPDALVDVASIVSRPIAFDERAQTIGLVVEVRTLKAHRIGGPPIPEPITASTAPPLGVLVNYDLTATAQGGGWNAYGFGSARVFSGVGTVQSDFSFARSSSGLRAVRLGTTYSYSDTRRTTTYSVGDVISGALPYSRSLRFGGLQISTNFALRPDLITYPVPIISGGAAVPSTVDVFVNGVRQLSTPVEAGPFSVPQLPVVTGAGQVSVAVRDASGRQTVQTSSFYISSALLKPGLSSFSAEAGAIRQSFGIESSGYGPLALSVTKRRGMTSSLTLEGHAEVSGKVATAMAGATLGLGTLATATAAFGVSRSPAGSGWQSYVSLERTDSSYHLGVSALASAAGFRDLGVLVGDSPPRHAIQANAGVILGQQGSLGIAYTDVAQRSGKVAFGPRDPILVPATRTSIVSGTYSRDVFGRAYVYVTAYGDLRSRNRAISAGLSLRFGGQSAVSASYESGSRQAVIETSRPAIDPGDIGWHGYAAHGATDRLLGEMSYRGSRAQLGMGVDYSSQSTAVRANARGSLVALGGGVFAATTITDAFALVDTQGYSNVAVLVNNRPAGRTDKNGRLLVPGLVSYQPNSISIDPGDLPLDTSWDRLDTNVVPSDRSGIVARFGVRRQREAVATIRFANGQPLPVGSQISLDGNPQTIGSGFDGQAYFADLEGHHRLNAKMPDGSHCQANLIVPSSMTWPAAITALCVVNTTAK